MRLNQVKTSAEEFLSLGIPNSVYPGEARGFDGPFSLNQWYRELAPGKYRLTVRRRTNGKAFSLTSNTVELEILANCCSPHLESRSFTH
jgi:hypothetical protein